jgi:xanthine dehydrogenase YagR molybdenum-binding subunit
VIGAPVNRVDGPKKVTGTATYSYEEWTLGQPLYGVIVGASIGYGRIEDIVTTRAEQAPGVRRVFSHRDRIPQHGPSGSGFDRYRLAYPTMASPQVRYFGDPVALVVAATYEQARSAAALVEVTYEPAAGRYDLAGLESEATIAGYVNAASRRSPASATSPARSRARRSGSTSSTRRRTSSRSRSSCTAASPRGTASCSSSTRASRSSARRSCGSRQRSASIRAR